jgi:hypothetical protein
LETAEAQVKASNHEYNAKSGKVGINDDSYEQFVDAEFA